MSSEIEEVVIRADARNSEYFAPNTRENLFRLVSRLSKVSLGMNTLCRRRQRAVIDFPIWGQRKLFEGNERRRHHILGQSLLQKCAQRSRRNYSIVADEVGNDPLTDRRIVTSHNRALLHLRMLSQRRFDLAKLDAIATNLHLIVDATEAFETTIGQITS